ncbi:hypothetical protein ACIRRA_00435, partial [Nocardia sp. NPDC101769]
MALELPSELEWLGWIVGVQWPDGNEDQMWDLANYWKSAADGLRGQVSNMDDAKYKTLAAYVDGDGRDAMAKQFDNMAGVGGKQDGNTSILDLAGFYDQIGESVHDTGTEIESTKLMFYSSLAMLAFEMAAAWIFPPTAPAAEAAAQAATRIAVRIIGREAVERIATYAAKMLGSSLAKFMVRHFVLDAGLGVLQEAGIEGYQIAAGHRSGFDWTKIGVTAVSSAAGGIAGGKVGKALGEHFESSAVNHYLAAAITGTTAGLAGGGAGFLAGTATQFGVDAYQHGWGDAFKNAGNAFTNFDPRMLTGGVANGGISGLNHAASHDFWGPRVARMRAGVSPDMANIGAVHDPGISAGNSTGGGHFGGSDNGVPASHAGGGHTSAGADAGGDNGGGTSGGRTGVGDTGGSSMHPAGFSGDTTDSGAAAHDNGDGSTARPEGGDQGGYGGSDSRSPADRGTEPTDTGATGGGDHGSQPSTAADGAPAGHAPADTGAQPQVGVHENTGGSVESGVQAGQHDVPAPASAPVGTGGAAPGDLGNSSGPGNTAPASAPANSAPASTSGGSAPASGSSTQSASTGGASTAAADAGARTSGTGSTDPSATSGGAPASAGPADSTTPVAPAASSPDAAASPPAEPRAAMAGAAGTSAPGASAAPHDAAAAPAVPGSDRSEPSIAASSNGSQAPGTSAPATAGSGTTAPGSPSTAAPQHGTATAPDARSSSDTPRATPDARATSPVRAGDGSGVRADAPRADAARPQGPDARPTGTEARPTGAEARPAGAQARGETPDANAGRPHETAEPISGRPDAEPIAAQSESNGTQPSDAAGQHLDGASSADSNASPEPGTHDPSAPDTGIADGRAGLDSTADPATPGEEPSPARDSESPSEPAVGDNSETRDPASPANDPAAPAADPAARPDAEHPAEQSNSRDGEPESSRSADESDPAAARDPESPADTAHDPDPAGALDHSGEEPGSAREADPHSDAEPQHGDPASEHPVEQPDSDAPAHADGSVPAVHDSDSARDHEIGRDSEPVSEIPSQRDESAVSADDPARGEADPAVQHEESPRQVDESAHDGAAERAGEPGEHPESRDSVHDPAESRPDEPERGTGRHPSEQHPSGQHAETGKPEERAQDGSHSDVRHESDGAQDGLLVAPVALGDHPLGRSGGTGEHRAPTGERRADAPESGRRSERPTSEVRPSERRDGQPARGDGAAEHPGSVREPGAHAGSAHPDEAPDHAAPQSDPAKATDGHPNRGRCGELALKLLRQLTGNDSIRIPDRVPGHEGMSVSEVVAKAGGKLRRYDDHQAIADRLLELGSGSSALVIDHYAGPADEHGVGGHAYLLVNEDGKIVVKDPAAGREHGFPPEIPRETEGTRAILFGDDGKPVDPLDEQTRHLLDPTNARHGGHGAKGKPEQEPADIHTQIVRGHDIAQHELRKAIANLEKTTGLKVTESDLTPAKLDDTMRDLEGRELKVKKGADPEAAFTKLRDAATGLHRADTLTRALIDADLAHAADVAHTAADPLAPSKTFEQPHEPASEREKSAGSEREGESEGIPIEERRWVAPEERSDLRVQGEKLGEVAFPESHAGELDTSASERGKSAGSGPEGESEGIPIEERRWVAPEERSDLRVQGEKLG